MVLYRKIDDFGAGMNGEKEKFSKYYAYSLLILIPL